MLSEAKHLWLLTSPATSYEPPTTTTSPTTMTRKTILLAASILALLAAAWCVFEFQPRRQIQKATERLLTDVENRDWDDVRDTLSPDYADAWGLDRSGIIELASQGFSQFFYLEITPTDWQIALTGDDSPRATVSVKLAFQGNGTGLAQLALGRLQAIDEPFVFHWRKESWQPWSWHLYSAGQPELRLSRDLLPL